jgi:hypothetical protein
VPHRASEHHHAKLPTDGSKIAFSWGAQHGGISVMSPDGSRLMRITTDPGDDQPSWSPGASEIAFDRSRHGRQDNAAFVGRFGLTTIAGAGSSKEVFPCQSALLRSMVPQAEQRT